MKLMSIAHPFRGHIMINGATVVDRSAAAPPRPDATTVWAAKPIKTPPYKTRVEAVGEAHGFKARHKG
jgi:hypothetical protein